MKRSNPFDGRGAYTKFVRTCYERLVGREWFAYSDVVSNKERVDERIPISKCDYYGELKKAFSDVRRLIEEKVGKGSIETRGNNRNKEFRYVGALDNPLEDYQNASAIKDIKTYAQFCLDSAGFIPKEWMEYFLKDTLDLLKIKRRRKNSEQFISTSVDRELTNIHLLPLLYEAVRDRKILAIDYQPYDENSDQLVFHPHILKEHNGRWFLFGHAEGKNPEFGYNLALDRIVEVKNTPTSINYLIPPKGFYNDFFKDIVGVTHYKGHAPQEIVIRAHQNKIFKLTETKKIHPSQETIKPFTQYEEGEYGEFKLFVEPNNEFIGRVLQMGPGLEIITPPEIRALFKRRVLKMIELYED